MVSDSFNSDRAFDYTKRRLKAEIPDRNYYHNIGHTRQVVSEAEKLATDSGFSQRDILMVKTAAWYHDIGHIE